MKRKIPSCWRGRRQSRIWSLRSRFGWRACSWTRTTRSLRRGLYRPSQFRSNRSCAGCFLCNLWMISNKVHVWTLLISFWNILVFHGGLHKFKAVVRSLPLFAVGVNCYQFERKLFISLVVGGELKILHLLILIFWANSQTSEQLTLNTSILKSRSV